jgi:hypothetical protein
MRYAVIFKTYTWDSFVHRQASRCRAATGDGDFFIMVDETNRSIGEIPFERVVRTTNAQLINFGLANRFEVGSLIWWNADYPHYQFKDQYPDYDYYVFVEYDAVIYGGIGYIVEHAAALTADLVTLPIATPKHEWFWTKFHRQAYRFAELQGSLNCVAVFSRRALTMLEGRRREMAIGESTRYWPSSEVFVATEIGRAGYISHSLAEFGSVKKFDWFPPMLEADLPNEAEHAFFHPVLDEQRYIASLLKSTTKVRSFFDPRSDMRRRLAQFPRKDYVPQLPAAALRRFRTTVNEKWQSACLRLSTGSFVEDK